MLSLPTQTHVPPMANVPSERPSLLTIGPPPQDVEAIHSQTMIPFSVEESASPLVEELSSDLFIDIVSDEVLIFVIFMHEIHGISVPSP